MKHFKFLLIRPVVSLSVLTLILATYFVAVLNTAFWERIEKAIQSEPAVKAGFVISLPLTLFALLFLIFTFFTFPRITKVFFAIIIPVSALANYAMTTYGVILDNNMIANIMETTSAEAGSYLNAQSVLWFILVGLMPVSALLWIKIKPQPVSKILLHKGAGILVALAVLGGIGAFYSKDYIAFFRNHKGVEKTIVPSYYTASAVKYFKSHYLHAHMAYTDMGLDAVVSPTHSENGKKDVLVFILGETARSQEYELDGYSRPTNRYTKELGVISFQNTASCGTATAESVPCMFSFMGRANYKDYLARNQSNVMDVIARTGLKTLWVENDEGCKGVCNRIPTIEFDKNTKPYCDGDVCQDHIFLKDIDEKIEGMKDTGGIIVLHIMGSHGPTYYKRYPPEHRFFKPDCPHSDIQNCSREEIVNTYDNTILFTDFVMAEIIKKLDRQKDTINPALIYISDHGESLGEKGIFLHGMPYAIAPEEQTKPPFIVWIPSQTAKTKNIDLTCMQKQADTRSVSHDFLSHSVLGLMGISTSLYNSDLDVFAPCKKV